MVHRVLHTSSYRAAAGSVVAGWALLACGSDRLLLPADAAPATLTVVAGNNQTAQVGEALAAAIVLRVSDATGRPVSGAHVSFQVASGTGGSISPATGTTNSSGEVAAQWELGPQAGAQSAKASVEGADLAPTTLTAFAAAGVAARLEIVRGDDQTAPVGTTLPDSLVVLATDASGNPVEGVGVAWAPENGGSVSANAVATAADGRAGIQRTLGPAAGQQATVASASGVPDAPVFSATATTGAAGKLTLVAQPSATAINGRALAEQPRAQLVDAFNNPVTQAGVAVTVAIDGNPSGVQLSGQRTVPTDAQGVAAFDGLSLTGPAGTYALRFTGSALADVVSRPIQLQAGPISASGSSLSVSPNSIVAIAGRSTVTVTVRDDLGFPVSGVSVVPAASPAAAFEPASGTTEGSGIATFQFNAPLAGTYRISARAGSVELAQTAEVSVTSAGSTTTITSDVPDPSGLFIPLTVAFQVTSAVGGVPDGTVTVREVEGSGTCTAPVSAGSCELRFSGVGSRTLVASYSGDGAHDGSSSVPEPHEVFLIAP
ncbi:MAG TPA: Ig-like domain-containing protein [Gemmatimonadales bacterium]|nr:Ig-like domain-containing protein [Gemmatimonadales bacterium]